MRISDWSSDVCSSDLFLLYAASHLDMRELSGIGLIVGAALIAVVVVLRQLYPAAMAANMRHGWMNFGAPAATGPRFDPQARARQIGRAAWRARVGQYD